MQHSMSGCCPQVFGYIQRLPLFLSAVPLNSFVKEVPQKDLYNLSTSDLLIIGNAIVKPEFVNQDKKILVLSNSSHLYWSFDVHLDPFAGFRTVPPAGSKRPAVKLSQSTARAKVFILFELWNSQNHFLFGNSNNCLCTKVTKHIFASLSTANVNFLSIIVTVSGAGGSVTTMRHSVT